MITALLHWIGEYCRKFFFLKGLAKPRNGGQTQVPPPPVSAPGSLPPSQSSGPNTLVTVASVPPPQSPPTVLGDDVETGEAVGLTLDERMQGLYVIGATGTGKTTLLLNMILSDISQNRGVCLIEPTGDLVKSTIGSMTERRLKDVIYLDITDPTASFGINFFETPQGADVAEVAKVASFVQHLFDAVWAAHTETTPRLAQVLRNTARVLIENPGMTFSEIPLLLWEDGVREKLMRRVTSTQTKLFFQHYNRRDPRGREELIASTINKADAYLHEQLVARIVSQSQSTIDFRRIMDEGKILLVHLSPQLEEPSRLIAAAILGRLLLASFGRADTPEKDRRPFMIYADEYQRYATNDFAVFLAESRKYRVGSTIANQTLEQLSDINRATALQAGSLVVGRVSGEDGDFLAKNFDATPGIEEVGVEPLRSPPADVIGHLVRRGHTDSRVTRFSQDYLVPLETYAGKPDRERHWASYNSHYGFLELHQLDISRGRDYLNQALYAAQSERRADISLNGLGVYLLALSVGNTMEYAFSNYIDTTSIDLFGLYRLRDSSACARLAAFGRPGFMDLAPRFVSIQRRKNRWMAERILSMLTELRYVLTVLSENPILVDTGQYVPKYRQRSYQDQENHISNMLSSQLANYHAKVRVLTAEHMIKMRPAPKLVSGPEVEARIREIKQRMLSMGYTKDAQAVDEEVAKRHEVLRQRPPGGAPPTHNTRGNKPTKP
jgi:hypothetical protein